MKLAKIAATLAGVAFVFAAASCDLAGDSESTSSSSSSGSSSSISDPSATAGQTNQVTGYVPIDAFTQIQWATVQEEDGTRIVIDDASTEIDPGNYPADQTPRLYFDVYFSTSLGTLFNNDSIVESFDAAEDASNTYSVSVGDLEDKLNVDQLTIGQTYYWGLVATTQDSEIEVKVSNSVTIAPPVNYSNVTLGYDFNGWYLTASFPAIYETTIADLYFGTTGAGATAIATGVHAYESAGSTVFKAYLATAPLAETTYYGYMISKDTVATAAAIATKGEVDRIEPRPSVSAISTWNFRAGTVPLTATTQTLATRNFSLSWADLEPVELDSTTYTLYIGTTNPPTTQASYTLSSAGGRYLADVDGLLYSTAYYAQVVAIGTYTDGASVDVADRTWSSPVVAFTTPNPMQSMLYTFDSGLAIPTAASTYMPGEIVRTAGTSVVDYGNPAPALSMAIGDSIYTTLGSSANKYTAATFRFDMKTASEQDCWLLFFQDQNHSSTSFDPTSYTIGNPSDMWADIHGPVIALQYYADSPFTSAANDPVYVVYGYYLAADNTVDTDLVTAGTQGDGDTDPDVVAVPMDVFATYNASGYPTAAYNTYKTFSVAVDTAAATPTATVSINGTAGDNALPLTSFSSTDRNSVIITGLNSMQFYAANDIMLDNVQYTASNGASPYMPSRR